MKNRILKELINKHRRTSLSLGIYQDELLKLGDANEVKKSIKELQKEKKIDSMLSPFFHCLQKSNHI